MIPEKVFKDIALGVLIFALFILAIFIVKPLALAIISGILLAYIFFPIYKKVLRIIKNRSVSAFLICILLLLVILVPLVFIFSSLMGQAINGYLALQNIDLTPIIAKIIPPIFFSSEISKNILSSVNTFIPKAMSYFIGSFGDFILNLPTMLLQGFIVLFVLFFALKDGEAGIEYLRTLSPFSKETFDKFLKHFKDVTDSVLIGQVVVGILQGVLAGVGYFIFGVPYIIILSIMTAIAAIIPLIGSWIIWFPVVIYLFVTGHTGEGIGLLIYGTLVISLLDNILKPIIISRRTKVSSIVIVIGMVGGLFVFGLLGFILGPLILAYVLLVMEIYRKNSKQDSLIFKNS
ncbi:MAG: AI-2E family transporter [Patescibacteria group bacterium]